MKKPSAPQISLSTGTDLAFTLVVFVSFFTAFSTSSITSVILITVIIFLGIAYISNGIYGFAYAKKSTNKYVKLAYFLIQYILGGLIIYYGKGAGFSALILLPVVAHTAMLLDQDLALAANVGVFATFLISSWAYSRSIAQIWNDLPIFFVSQVIILIFIQMALIELRAREKLEKLAEELSEANRHLSEYADQVHDLSVSQERNRFAREIHDGLGHYLTTIKMQLNAAQTVVKTNPEAATHMLEKAQEMTSEALVDVRNSVYALRKDSIIIESLVERVEKLITDTRQEGMQVNFNVKGSIRDLSPQADLTIYRTAQEALNNAYKHSQATKVDCILNYGEDGVVTFTLEDDGIGANEYQKGFGLIGIQERARLMNGEVSFSTTPGEGFMVQIQIPG